MDSDDAEVVRTVGYIAAAVAEHGGYVHPDLVVNHHGSLLWLSAPRGADRHPAPDRPAPDAPPLLEVPHRLHIPVTDLDWDPDLDHLAFRGDTGHLTDVQRSLLNAMVDLFNACDKVVGVGTAYPQVALARDGELLQLVREARPHYSAQMQSPVDLVVRSRLRSEMGEGDEGPLGYFMPMIDMLNHHPYGSRYERGEDGRWVIRLHHPGPDDQVFVRYNKADSLGVALGLGYVESATRFVSSVAGSREVAGLGLVHIAGVAAHRRRLPAPRLTWQDDGLHIAGLVLEAGRLSQLRTLLAMPLVASGRAADMAQATLLAQRLIDAVVDINRGLFLRMASLCASGGEGEQSLRPLFGQVAAHQLDLLDQMDSTSTVDLTTSRGTGAAAPRMAP